MKAEIIVPTYENADYTVRCFESVYEYTDNYRLVWVDNGSSEESRKTVLKEIGRHPSYLTAWLPYNAGFIGGTNHGLRLVLDAYETDAEYIVFLNNDVEVSPEWLNILMNVLEEDYNLGAVGPVTSECSSWQSFANASQVIPMFQIPARFGGMDTIQRGKTLSYAYGNTYRPCKMLAFFCTVFKKRVFEEIGYLDEDYGYGLGDDDDFCKRMNNNGLRCAFSMGSYVFHNHRTTFRTIYSDDEMRDVQKTHLGIFKDKHGEDARI